jgi:hypothetical protein
MRIHSLLLIGAVAACSVPRTDAPSLAPRAAEANDPRVRIPSEPVPGAVTPGLAASLATLVSQARQGDSAFQAAAAEAERLAAAAGPLQSESWVVAQQALSAAVAAREPVTKALGDVDALGSSELAMRGGVSAADQAAIAAAASIVGELDGRQAAAIDRLQRRLGG